MYTDPITLTTALKDTHRYDPHFTDEETEAQRDKVAQPVREGAGGQTRLVQLRSTFCLLCSPLLTGVADIPAGVSLGNSTPDLGGSSFEQGETLSRSQQ